MIDMGKIKKGESDFQHGSLEIVAGLGKNITLRF